MKVCPKCSKKYSDEYKFCLKDGGLLQDIAGNLENDKLICSKCQTINNPNYKYCKACGNTLSSESTKIINKEDSIPLSKTSQHKITSKEDIKNKVTEPIQSPTSLQVESLESQSSNKTILLVIAVCLLIIISAVGGYYLFSTLFKVDPEKIQEKIQFELTEKGLNNIVVTINDKWEATLTGTVKNKEQRDLAMDIVKNYKEIKLITNELAMKVLPNNNLTDQKVVLRDMPAETYRKINYALTINNLKGISVEVTDSVIILKGAVNNMDDKQKILSIAQSYSKGRKIKDIIFIVEHR